MKMMTEDKRKIGGVSAIYGNVYMNMNSVFPKRCTSEYKLRASCRKERGVFTFGE